MAEQRKEGLKKENERRKERRPRRVRWVDARRGVTCGDELDGRQKFLGNGSTGSSNARAVLEQKLYQYLTYLMS